MSPQENPGDINGKLWKLWHLVLDSLIRYLEETPPKDQTAFMLLAATRFLKLNDVRFSAHNKAQQQSALKALRGIDLPFQK